MTMKSVLIVTVVLLLFFLSLVPANAVDTLAMEAVRSKKVLDESDLKTIDNFFAEAIGEILMAEDFSSISNSRAIIIANSASRELGQAQFDQQFSESAQRHISAALEQASGFTPPQRSFKVMTNLFMLLDYLADVRLIEIPLRYIDSENTSVRYWAVHCITNPEIIEKLKTSQELDTARNIARRLDEIVATSSPEVLGMIASYGGSITVTEGEELLLKVADRRISAYADWSVEYELLDGRILELLSNKMGPSDPGRAEAGKRFGQLFSYVFQRYIKGADILTPSQQEQLMSVLVETEKTCLRKLTGKPQAGIKNAIESGDTKALLEEHNRLLGNAGEAGLLPDKMDFDYGKDQNGVTLQQPAQLVSAPEMKGA